MCCSFLCEGSLLARIILQPIEETLRVHFSRAKAEAGDEHVVQEEVPNEKDAKSEKPGQAVKQRKKAPSKAQGAEKSETTTVRADASISSTDRARRTLLDVLAVQLGLSLIFLTFAVPYLPVLLPFVLVRI